MERNKDMKIVVLGIAIVLTGLVLTSTANAQVVWTDWTAGTTGANAVASGTLTLDTTTVNVDYSGQIQFIQTSGGTNYWSPSAPYISAGVSAPPTPDIIALSVATTRTITFSQPILNPLFAVVSLNGNGYRFNRDFEIISQGAGYWGNGTLSKNALTGGIFQLNGSGEPHGVIEFQGAISSITWDSLTDENWNGFTIGVRGLAPAIVPESGTMSLFVAALLPAVGLIVRRRK